MNEKTDSEDSIDHKVLKIHFFYVVLILSLLIILLAATEWTTLPKFIEYLSTAATITSLVLGLLAIIYAYISNDALSKTIGAVSEASSSASDATGKMSLLLVNVDNATEKTVQSNQAMQSLIFELKREIATLSETANTLDTKTQLIAEVLPGIPLGMERLEKKMDEQLFKTTEQHIQNQSEVGLNVGEKSAIAKRMIEKTSVNGLFLIYMIYLSFKNNKKFKINLLDGEFGDPEYKYGYFIALASFLIDASVNDDEITVRSCPEEFSKVKEEIQERSEKYLDSYPDVDKEADEIRKKVWIKTLEKIEKTIK